MRKRKYAHSANTTCINDCMTENIDLFCKQKKNKQRIPEAFIHNLVGTAQIVSSVQPFDLKKISLLLPNSIYDKQKFAAITIRLFDPYCTILLFTSGKMVLTGCKTFLQCVLASQHVVRFLQKGMPSCKIYLENVNIQNIVGNVDLNFRGKKTFALQRFFDENSVFCTYQKSMFPGLIYRPNNSPVVLLLFQSGKIVITGGKSTNDVMTGWQTLWPFVEQYIVDI